VTVDAVLGPAAASWSLRRTELPSGVPAAVFANPASPTASILVAFRDGVAYEQDDEWGCSHFVEHALLRGSHRYPTLQGLSRAVEGVGGRISAFSTREMTAFWVKMPSSYVARGADVLADVLTAPLLDTEHIEAERAIIRQERQRELANPSLVTSLFIEGVALLPARMARHPIGTPAVIERIDGARLRTHLAEVYHRGNVVIAAAGAVDESVEGILEAVVEGLSLGERRVAPTEVLVSSYGGATTFWIPSQHTRQTFVGASWTVPITCRRERYAFRVLNTLLGAGYTSMLNVRLRERDNVSYLVTTMANVYGELGVFKVNFAVAPDDVERALAGVEEVVAAVATGSVDDELIREAADRHAGAVVFSMEDSLNPARFAVPALLAEETVVSYAEHAAELADVTPDDVGSLAERCFREDGRRVVLLTGVTSGRDVAPDAVEVLRAADGSPIWY